MNFAIAAARMAAHTHCRQVMVLDVRGLSPVADFFIIATGTSPRQMRSVCDDIDELAHQHNYKLLHHAGLDSESWVVADYVEVIVHVFSADARQFYDLEGLWGDAKLISWEDPTTPTDAANR